MLDREAVEGVASVNRDIRDVARHDPFASFNPTTRGVQIAGTNNRTNKFSVDGLNFSDSFGSTRAACRPRVARCPWTRWSSCR